jgi:hypothetical protein
VNYLKLVGKSKIYFLAIFFVTKSSKLFKSLKCANDSFTELTFQYRENDRIHEFQIILSEKVNLKKTHLNFFFLLNFNLTK